MKPGKIALRDRAADHPLSWVLDAQGLDLIRCIAWQNAHIETVFAIPLSGRLRTRNPWSSFGYWDYWSHAPVWLQVPRVQQWLHGRRSRLGGNRDSNLLPWHGPRYLALTAQASQYASPGRKHTFGKDPTTVHFEIQTDNRWAVIMPGKAGPRCPSGYDFVGHKRIGIVDSV